MSKSPGHRAHPEHKVQETLLPHQVTASIDGQVVAESDQVIRVDEDGAPARYYFPRAAVRVDRLERSATTTNCPFKGEATYYDFSHGGHRWDDAIWSYEDPYDEHLALQGRMAFYQERLPGLRVDEAPAA
ncbi:MAG: DUF427 domain-containing protein [Burkholderiaceae bacterium]